MSPRSIGRRKGASSWTKDQIQAEVERLGAEQEWAHEIEFPHGVRSRRPYPYDPGKNVYKIKRLAPILDGLDLEGKRVLDVGCNEGFYSVEAARRGAQVLGVDIDPQRIEKARFVKQVLDVEGADFQVADIYSPGFEKLGTFDVCMALGFVHRLPDPLTAIQRIVERADISIFEWMVLRRGIPGEPLAHYIPGQIVQGVWMNPKYWRPTPECLVAILRDLGYKHFRLIDDRKLYRVILAAGRDDHPVLRAQRGDLKPRRGLELVRLMRDFSIGLGRTIRGR